MVAPGLSPLLVITRLCLLFTWLCFVTFKELYSHLEGGLGRNMTARCSSSQTQVISDAQKDMAGQFVFCWSRRNSYYRTVLLGVSHFD